MNKFFGVGHSTPAKGLAKIPVTAAYLRTIALEAAAGLSSRELRRNSSHLQIVIPREGGNDEGAQVNAILATISSADRHPREGGDPYSHVTGSA